MFLIFIHFPLFLNPHAYIYTKKYGDIFFATNLPPEVAASWVTHEVGQKAGYHQGVAVNS